MPEHNLVMRKSPYVGMKAVATAKTALVARAETRVLLRPTLSPRVPHTRPPIIIPRKDTAAVLKRGLGGDILLHILLFWVEYYQISAIKDTKS